MRLRPLLLLALAVGVVGCAVVGTYRVIDEVSHPRRACAHQLPPFEGLEITSVTRSWTPPVVRCRYFAAAVDQLGSDRPVNAVTAKNLVVVGGLDVAAICALGLMRGSIRRRWRSG